MIGYYTPFLIAGSALFTIGGGLLSTLDISSGAGKYIGYQLLLGIGQGLAIQMPVIAVQAFAQPADIPAATAIILCTFKASPPLLPSFRFLLILNSVFQMMGGTIWVAAGQAVFDNQLLIAISKHGSDLDTVTVLQAGASQLRTFFSGPALEDVLESYVKALQVTFAVGTAAAGVACLLALMAPFRSIKKAAASAGGAA